MGSTVESRARSGRRRVPGVNVRRRPASPGSGKSGVLYGLTPEYDGPKTLSRISPKTLASFGKTLQVSGDAYAGALSPDGTRLLMIGGSPTGSGGQVPRLSIVDLGGMRFDSAIQPRSTTTSPANRSWPPPGRAPTGCSSWRSVSARPSRIPSAGERSFRRACLRSIRSPVLSSGCGA